MRKFKELDFVILKKWGTISRIMKIEGNMVKLRSVSSTTGQQTHRYNTPYTYQSWTSLETLKKNYKLIGTEQILISMWHNSQKVRF